MVIWCPSLAQAPDTTIPAISTKETPMNDDEINDGYELVMLADNETAWRTLVFDKFKQILNEIKTLQSNPIQNVIRSKSFFKNELKSNCKMKFSTTKESSN